MADLILSVDTALGEVPINLIALIDDTDFKTREESVTFDQSGLDLVFNFIDKDGVFTQTAVTPTDTAGVYDWVNQGNGMYTIEIPASGGGTINNDSEGFGWFTGFATGVLPWRGPMIHFAPPNIVDSLVDGSDLLDVSLVQIGGDVQSGTDLKDFADAGYDPATNSVEQVKVNDDVRGTDNAALASVLGALNDAAAAGDVTTADTLMQYLKQVINLLAGGPGIGTNPSAAVPANAVNIFEILNSLSDRIPSALVSGAMDSDVSVMQTSVIAATTYAAGARDAAGQATDAEEAIADALLGRNIAGGSDGGRTVTDALRILRNRKAISGGTLTVFQENDITTAWTGVVTTTAGDPISEIDPV